MKGQFTEDELYLLRMYDADNLEQLQDMMDVARQFSDDSRASDILRDLMLKMARLTEEEFQQIRQG